MSEQHTVLSTQTCIHSNQAEWKKIAVMYFLGEPIYCPGCKNLFNLEGVAKHFEAKDFLILATSQLLDFGWSTAVNISIFPDQTLEILTSALNIPDRTRIIEVICTANSGGGLRPVYEPPQALNHRRSPKSLTIHPIKYQSNCTETKISLAVAWVSNPEQDILYHAFKNYIDVDPRYAIVPLNTYIESKFKIFLNKNFLFTNKKRSKPKHITDLENFKNKFFDFLRKNNLHISEDNISETIGHLKELARTRHDHAHNNNVEKFNGLEKWFAAVVLFNYLLEALEALNETLDDNNNGPLIQNALESIRQYQTIK